MKITRRQLKKLIHESLANKKVVELETSYAFILKDDKSEYRMRIVLDEFDEVAGALVALKAQGYTHVYSQEEKAMYTIGEMIQSFDDYEQHTDHYNPNLPSVVLKEFKFTGQDFDDSILSGDLPPADSDSRGGGGGNRLHQLVRVNFDQGSEFNPRSYTKTVIDVSPNSTYSKMRDLYRSFSNQTKNALYQMAPGAVSHEDMDAAYEFRNEFIRLINGFDDAVPVSSDYEYFTVFHPSYASHGGGTDEGERRALDLYRSVTGYTPDEDLLAEYEIIMHSAGAML